MDDDLDTPGVIDLVFRTVRVANIALDADDAAAAAPLAAAVIEICNAVGLVIDQAPGGSDPGRRHCACRAARRSEGRTGLGSGRRVARPTPVRGWLVEDTASGTIVRRP